MDDFASHYHVVAYSLRYHYPNTWTEGQYSYQIHIADLVALLQALKNWFEALSLQSLASLR
jgi:hypothetical protein